MSTSFTLEDLRTSANIMRNFYGIPVSEVPLTTNEQRLDKYLSLSDLSEFMKTFSESEAEIRAA